MMELVIYKSTIRDRKGLAYIDCQSSAGRLRFSTGESYSKKSVADISSRIKELAISFLKGKGVRERAKQLKESSKTTKPLDLQGLGDEFVRVRCGGLKEQSISAYKSLSRQIAKASQNPQVALLDQSDYNEIADMLKASELAFFNRLIDYAKQCEYIKAKILPIKAKKLQIQEHKILPLSLQESKAVLDMCEYLASSDPKWLEVRNYLGFAMFSGARVGEILALQESDIDFENKKVHICKSKLRKKARTTTTKTGKARYIDLLDIAQKSLISQLQIHALKQDRKCARIFSFDESYIGAKWKQVLKACGLQERVLYQTRHTFATIMLVHKEEPLWISAMLGHSSLHTTFTHYVKYIPQMKERAKFVDFTINVGGGIC